LLAEALVRICMKNYGCNKDMAESYLNVYNNSKNRPQWETFLLGYNAETNIHDIF
jgi:hypothetical protein